MAEGIATGEGVLLTGAYGTGKSSVVEEIAGMLEGVDAPYAALDLDWLLWFDAPGVDHEQVFLANLADVVANYLAAGVRYFAMAGAIRDARALAALRAAVSFPVRVVRLVVPLPEIERRLGTAVTAGRADDLVVAGEWIAGGVGEGIEDVVVDNDRPIADTAADVMSSLGWPGADRTAR